MVMIIYNDYQFNDMMQLKNDYKASEVEEPKLSDQ